MSAFRKIGPAIGALSAAISAAGGLGAEFGDVRLFPPGVDPGSSWASENVLRAYDPKLENILAPSSGGFPSATTVQPNMSGLLYGAGLYVTYGASGTIFTSPDGVTWTQRVSNAGSSGLQGGIYANGLFVIGGSANGTIITSPDGINWTARVSPFTNVVFDFAYGNGVFVAGGNAGAIATSPDGITWTLQTNPLTSNVRAVAYGNGLFVAGQGSQGATSPDGVTWTAKTLPITGTLYCAIFAAGQFVIGGTATSTANGQIATSPDGITWTLQAISSSGDLIYAIAYGAGLYVAVAQGGRIFVSLDGVSWPAQTSPVSAAIVDVCYGLEGRFIAITTTATLGMTVRQKGISAPVRSAANRNKVAFTRIAA